MGDVARIRFVEDTAVSSRLIEAREDTTYPLIPSHTELVLPEGYLGALLSGGVQVRPVGYDRGFSKELFVDVPCDAACAEAYARSKIGSRYDWVSILDFVVPLALHTPGSFICSALMVQTLTSGAAFAGSLAKPAYLISPADLLLVLSGMVKVL